MNRNWFRTAKAITRVHSICNAYSVSPRLMLDVLGEASGQLNITSLNLEYADLGGVNNQGIFLHYGDSASQPVALSKIQTPELAEREFRFIRWADSRGLRLTAQPVYHRRLSDELAVTSSTYLCQPGHYLASAVHALHWRMMNVRDYETILGDRYTLRSQVRPDTNIRKVLHNLVSEPSPGKAHAFIEDFFNERESVLGERLCEDILRIVKIFIGRWEYLYDVDTGLVHGDFKRQNILSVSDFDYRLIDLQYYLTGMRSWDLAFYYSKYNEGFNFALMDYRGANRILKTSQEPLFVLFYLIAASLKIKLKHRDLILQRKIQPAVNYFNHQGTHAI